MKPIFFYIFFVAGLSRFMAAFRLSRKTAEYRSIDLAGVKAGHVHLCLLAGR